MTLHIKFIDEMILVLLFSIIHQSNAEYYIKGEVVQPPSYLKYNFTNISSNIFPNNLEVKFVMWHPIGTIVYSMDKNGNQFILEVSHFINVPYLIIKIRGKKRRKDLKELCGFKQNYKQENVTLLVKIKETNLSISCNGNNEFYIEVQNKKEVHPKWPVPPFPNSLHNQAILWALNVPNKYGGYSDPYQIGCCLFYVKYNNKVINMTVYGSGIKIKCPKSCTLYPCNRGEICVERYTYTKQKYCYNATTITTITGLSRENATIFKQSNSQIEIALSSLLVLAIIIIIIFIIYICYRRRLTKKWNDVEKTVRLIPINYSTNSIETQYSPDSPILIGFGIRDITMMIINESINEHLIKYNLSCNTVCTDIPNKRAIMIDIMQCKVVVVVYNVAKSNNKICEFMCQLTEQYGKQLIPLVISTDKFISNENMRKLLQNHDNLMYFDDVWSIKRGAPKIANKIKHYLDIYTPIEVAPLPKTDNNVIYVVNCKTYNIFDKVLFAFQKYNYEYNIIVDSHTDGKQFSMLDNINKAHALIFCCRGKYNLCMYHKLVYKYCMDKKLVIPLVVNYIPECTLEWRDTLLHNNHSILIDISDDTKPDPDKIAADIYYIIQNYVLIIDCGFNENELSAIKESLQQKKVKCRTQYEFDNYEKEIIKYINSSNVIVMPVKLDGNSSSVDIDIFIFLCCIAELRGKYVVLLLLGQETGGKYLDNLTEYLQSNKNIFKFTNIDQLKESANKIAECINKLNGNINNEVKYKTERNSNIIYLVNCTNSRKLNKFVKMLINKKYLVIEDDHSYNKNFIELTKSITSALSVIFVMENNDTECRYHRMLYKCCRGLGALIIPVLINYTADTLPHWMRDMWDSDLCRKYDTYEKFDNNIENVISKKIALQSMVKFSIRFNFII